MSIRRLEIRSSLPAIFALLCTVFCISNTTCPAFAQDDTSSRAERLVWEAGAAKVDVTPSYPIRLNGFGGRREESNGISQPIWARALAVRYGGGSALASTSNTPNAKSVHDSTAVIVTLDNLGIRLGMVNEVAERVARKTGLLREQIAFTFTHTHCAPKVNGASDNIFSAPIPTEHQAHIDQYTVELASALESVVLAAMDDMQPASLEWGIGTAGFASNRRTPGGPVDHSLPVLVVRGKDQTIKAIYTTYACHCVTLSHNLISGDWAGYAAANIERLFPDAVGMVSIGCGSDQNPSSGVTGDKTQIAEQQGIEIASEIDRLIRDGLQPLQGSVTATLQQIALEFNTLPSRVEYEAMAANGGPMGYNASTQLAKLDRGESLPKALIYPVQTLSFGNDLCMVFLGGEVCVDYAILLRKNLAAEKLWIHGYSNDFGAYIPSERLVREGGYGGGAEIPYFALPMTLKAGLEQQILDQVLTQTPAEFHVQHGTQGNPPKSPEQSLKSMKTHDHLKIELVAAEPLVSDPVAIDFGPDGRVWVCQMNDYARGVEEEFAPTGQINVLSDRDQDGQYETSTIFMDGLRYPTDIKVWRNGALICDAPAIIYAEDTNADGVADLRRVLFNGFATHNGQARVNSLQWGLDNWLYGSSGLFGGVITNEHGQTVDVTDRDFRLNPDSGIIEPVTGRTQQDRVRDDWDNWFGCDNSMLIRHYPVADDYARRNPFIRPATTSVSVPTGENPGTLFPAGDLVLFKLSGSGGSATAACGVGIYRDTLLGDEFYGNSLTCEPVNQLVYRQILSRNGATFEGRRADSEKHSDFLTSTDRWFRPVQAKTGPDGGLWIVDMYRYVIEHPRWIPDETLAELNVFAGQKMGRIYRIVPKLRADRPSVDVPFDLTQLPPDQLARQMNTANGTRRDLIQQMLLWQSNNESAESLTHIATESQIPAARLSALCTLDGLNATTPHILLAALDDPHPEVRRHAIRLSEPFLNDNSELRRAVFDRVDDPHFEVRLQLAYSAGTCSAEIAADTLVTVATSTEDPWLTAAVLSSLNDNNLAAVIKQTLGQGKASAVFQEQLLTTAAGMANETTVARIFEIVFRKDTDWKLWQFEAAAGLLNGLNRRQLDLASGTQLPFANAAQDLLATARRTLQSNNASEETILASLLLLGQRSGPVSESLFGKPSGDDSISIAAQISPLRPDPIQAAAVEALARRGQSEDASALLTRLPGTTPGVRRRLIRELMSQRAWIPTLVDAFEANTLIPGDFDASDHERLLAQTQGEMRERVVRILASSRSTNRQQLVHEWHDVLSMPGSPVEGRAVFVKRCSLCHKLDDIGFEVGPNLASLTTRSASFLLTAILDPSRDVDGRFQNYVAVTDDGRSFQGILTTETSTSLTLREQEAKDHVLLRNQLEDFKATGKSAMPEGIEKDISKQDLANLLNFLMESTPASKVFAGNKPTTVIPDESSQVVLTATVAAIYGGDIAFESSSPFQNIGYWHGAADAAVWTLKIEQPGSYDVWLDYACDNQSQGNNLLVESGAEALSYPIRGTGGWDQYRQIRIGSIALTSGANRVTLRPDAGFRGPALLDLRAIALVPKGQTPTILMTPLETSTEPSVPSEIAAAILDESRPMQDRERLVEVSASQSAAVIAALADGIGQRDDEEYRRIPWIWRVAIAAGKRNQSDEILSILNVSLPASDSPLLDWQSVVVGGGLINGISQTGVWPRDRLDRLIAGNHDLSSRWDHTIAQASEMADNSTIRTGTRYDALRIIAIESWELHGAQLSGYLAEGIDDELQMGAISGLNDMPAAEAGIAIVQHLPHFSVHNRTLAIEAMLRTTPRTIRLLQAIEDGKIDKDLISPEMKSTIQNHSDPAVRAKAANL